MTAGPLTRIVAAIAFLTARGVAQSALVVVQGGPLLTAGVPSAGLAAPPVPALASRNSHVQLIAVDPAFTSAILSQAASVADLDFAY